MSKTQKHFFMVLMASFVGGQKKLPTLLYFYLDLTGFKNLSGLSFPKTEKGIIHVENQGFYALSHYFIF